MNISSTSSVLGTAYSTVSSNNDDVSQLEKEKASLQKELQKISQSKGDENTKQQKIKELQAQIEQIHAEIQQKKSEKNNQNQNNIQQLSVGASNGNDTINKSSTSVDSVKASSANIIDTWA